uniref:Kinesin-like protein KIF15 n=1 Tax=Anthurium amnicola TaxID=1678845 RepID=A0A1D1Z8I8_9ARAE
MKAFFHARIGKVPPAESPTPNSHPKQRPSSRGAKENVDPSSASSPSENAPLRSPSAAGRPPLAPKARSPLHPRPLTNPSDAPPKRKKLSLETLPENGAPAVAAAAAAAPDAGVQVIVRIRPLNRDHEEGDQIVHKISADSVSILDHAFTFDSVADPRSTQEDIFQLVGRPLVENCLAGFNSSIFAYGQTGSGKTYTMWGPPSALLEDGSSGTEQGLTPRVFELLFSRINEEQIKHSDEKLSYQCHCSFLEIYNEQIMDLLNPCQMNLQIREDVRTGVYVDCLSEVYVCTMKDVTQLLLKGLANRRIGATSVNAESSRAHCVFTCVVESRSKSAADGLNSLRVSRMNLVDLAGSERQKLTGAAGERLKEAGNINRSLSQLGNLINILAEVSQSGRQRHIPYRDSKLTFLLQESLGGNAKLAMICAISPSQSCKSETFSTLRFAKRAKGIKNKAVVNEIMQDDVNVLREQIRQLKDELLRMKSGVSAESNGSYATGWNARRSLNLLKMSLGCPTVLPVIDDDSDEEMEIDEEDVKRPCVQSCLQSAASEENIKDTHTAPLKQVDLEDSSLASDGDGASYEEIKPEHTTRCSCGSDQTSEADIISEGCKQAGTAIDAVSSISSPANDDYMNGSDKIRTLQKTGELLSISSREESKERTVVLQDSTLIECEFMWEKSSAHSDFHVDKDTTDDPALDSCHNSSSKSPHSVRCDLSIVPCHASPNLQPPTLSISSGVDNNANESSRISSSMPAFQNDLLENLKSRSEVIKHPSAQVKCSKSKSSLSLTENLVASLHRGIQILDNHRQKSPVGCSSFRFSFRPVDIEPLLPISTNDIGIQTVSSNSEILEDLLPFICSYCKNKAPPLEYEHLTDQKELHPVPANEMRSVDKSKKQVPKAVEKVLAGAIRREMALEDHCAKQNAEIAQLKRLIQQYKHERECNVIIEQIRGDKICRLESLMDGILPTEEFMGKEFISLLNEHKVLKEKYDNHPEVLRINIELKRVQNEVEKHGNFFDLGEREVLMEEIQDLKSQLQYYVDNSPMPPRRRTPLLQLMYPNEPTPAPHGRIPELTKECAHEKFEEERNRWTETESKWISLSEELRLELEASRSVAEKMKMELDSEKKCSEELKEALETAMQGHARILDQYADLQEKHIALLSRHQQIREGIQEVKQAAARAGVRGAESKFINSLAAQISALKVEREKERRYWKDENKGLQSQLKDTAEAVQAAGELLVRLKEAEEAIAVAQKRTVAAEKEAEKAYKEIENLKKRHKTEIDTMNQFLAESRLPKEAWIRSTCDADNVKYDGGNSSADEQWRDEFETFNQRDGEFSRGAEQSSWFSGYDRCNI